MRVTYDHVAQAGYIYLIDDIKPGEAVKQIAIPGHDIVLDFNRAGHLIGIEILDPKALPPVLLDQATED